MNEKIKIDTGTGYPIYDKDPSAELPYGHDFTGWLEGATIDQNATTVTVPEAPGELTKGILWFQPINHAGVWLSGGTVGVRYTCVVHLVTTDTPAKLDDRSFIIRMVEK